MRSFVDRNALFCQIRYMVMLLLTKCFLMLVLQKVPNVTIFWKSIKMLTEMLRTQPRQNSVRVKRGQADPGFSYSKLNDIMSISCKY